VTTTWSRFPRWRSWQAATVPAVFRDNCPIFFQLFQISSFLAVGAVRRVNGSIKLDVLIGFAPAFAFWYPAGRHIKIMPV
ncbi:MAG: hypothetical protein Q4D50_12470, partial [Eubacteriales bacterium]|nr:hypothetical protein [Eubacteriales bacterium]